MAKSNYDVNVQLALATSAEADGQLDDALAYLAAAHVHARDDRDVHAQVHRVTAQFFARHRDPAGAIELPAFGMLASAL